MKPGNQLVVISVPLKDVLKPQSTIAEILCSGKCKQCQNKTNCADKLVR